MTMPGFTAEASLQKTNGRYRLAVNRAGGASTRVGPAQFLLPDGDFCRPSCGPCRVIPEAGPGLWRLCLTRSCEE